MNYFDVVRRGDPKLTDLQIEFLLAQKAKVENLTGLSQLEHRMNAMRLLFPERVQIDWYRKKAESFDRARRERIKEVGWWGCTNSIKTSGFADIALTAWWENPDNTSIYIASPYKQATETNLWARIVEQFHSAKDAHSWLPGQLVTSQAKIIQYARNPLSFIQVATVDEVAKLVGKKSKNFAEGLLLVIIDEAPELPNAGEEMLEVLKNLRGVPNFILMYAGNFRDTGDFMGRISEPVGGYEAIKGQEDTLFEFRTKRRGIVYRFDGHHSPNFQAGRDIYDFVCTMEYAEDTAHTSGGTSSPGYMRFVRSWPVMGMAEFRVTNSNKIEAGGAEKLAHWNADELIRISFCDPGFGGDACVIQDIRVGLEMQGGRLVQVAELDGPPIVVPIDMNKVDDAGMPIDAEKQIVLFHKAHAEGKSIPAGNCGFDGSLRSGIVHGYAKHWSLDVIPVEPQGGATSRVYDAKNNRSWADEAANFVSETWFAAGLLIQSGQLRGLGYSPAAKEQLCKRPWLWNGKRKQIQPKDKFKLSNAGKSPNEADALCGAIEIARRRGLNVLALTGQGTGGIALLQRIMREREQNAEVKRILGGNRLPPGRLNGMDFPGNGRRYLNS